MRRHAPTTLQEAKPEAGSIPWPNCIKWGFGMRIADGSEAQKSNVAGMKVRGRPRLH